VGVEKVKLKIMVAIGTSLMEAQNTAQLSGRVLKN